MSNGLRSHQDHPFSFIGTTAAFIMYYPGGGGSRDFINQYSIFSCPLHSFPKISSPPERMDQILLSPPPLLEFEFLVLARYAMTVVHCFCHVGGWGGFEPQVGPACAALGNSEDFKFEDTKKRPKNHCCYSFFVV